ncbi:MAG: MCP four helix bundle domain-containing protein, partial [Candidatus Limnocylindrales bacterium]
MHLNVRTKLLGTSAVLLAFMVAVGLLAIVNLGTVDQIGSAIYDSGVVPMNDLSDARAAVADLNTQVLRAVAAGSVTGTSDAAAADITTFDATLAKYAAGDQTQTEKDQLAALNASWPPFKQAVSDFLSATATGGSDALTQARDAYVRTGEPAFATVDKQLGDLINTQDTQANDLGNQITSTYESSRLITIIAILLAVIIGFALSFWLARMIVRGVTDVQNTMAVLSEKDATWLAEGMGRLQDNDLTYSITPAATQIEKYGTDEIGKTAEYANSLRDKIVAAVEAYNAARDGLAGTITEVQEAADSVSRTSEQLNDAAAQTGAATQQVATTISQVAGGTAEQARAAADTNAAVEELSAVIAT